MAPRHRYALQTPAEKVVEAVVAVMRDGMSQMDAHRTYSVPRRTLQRYIERIRADLGKHSVTVDRRPRGEGVHRVLAIGDMHDAPYLNKDRFEWLGKYAAAKKVDAVIQVGDIASLDSINGHERNESWRGRAKPTFQMDMASLGAALERFDQGLGGYRVSKHVTLGNHEGRVWFFEDKNPELFGMMRDELEEVLSSNGWSWTPYGEYYDFGGVAFVHAPLNGANRPAGGVNVANMAGRTSTCDIVFGHTHRRNQRTEPKLNGEIITVIEAGCALPEHHVERYAGHGLTGWSWGAWLLVIRDGRIDGFNWISMAELQRRYA